MTPEGSSGFWDTYRAPRSDPRTIVTPDAFSVHPDLLGVPLAQHSRRVVAILVDLLLVAIVTQLGGLLLGILAVIFLFRATFKQKDDARAPSIMGTAFRGVVGCFGFMVLLVTVIVLIGTFADRPATVQPGDGSVQAIHDQVEREVREQLRAMGIPEPGDSPAPPVAEESEPEGLEEPESEEPAESEGDGSELDPGEPAVAVDLPPELLDTLHTLEARLAEETRRRAQAEATAQETREELQAARQEVEAASRFPGIRAVLSRIAEDLGLGFGWAALYFTVFTTWWNGRTPGKRMARIRVVKLSGEPLTWWDSFERYGGYAAGFATGLLGFIQVYWDPNRQAIHDRIGRTVVVQDGKPPVPGRWNAASQKPGGGGDRGPSAQPPPRPTIPGDAPPAGPRSHGKTP